MQQKYLCLNCGALVSVAEKYCGYCGFHLKQPLDKMLPQMAFAAHGHSNATRQQTSDRLYPFYLRPQTSDGERQNSRPTGSATAAGNVKPIHNEIIKLLSDILNK